MLQRQAKTYTANKMFHLSANTLLDSTLNLNTMSRPCTQFEEHIQHFTAIKVLQQTGWQCPRERFCRCCLLRYAGLVLASQNCPLGSLALNGDDNSEEEDDADGANVLLTDTTSEDEDDDNHREDESEEEDETKKVGCSPYF